MLNKILHVLRIILDPAPKLRGFVAGVIIGALAGMASLVIGQMWALLAGAILTALATYYIIVWSASR